MTTTESADYADYADLKTTTNELIVRTALHLET
jgi:hypothetical protein